MKQLDQIGKYLLIKYEDLINNSEKTFLKILDFIKKISGVEIEIDENRIKKIIENTKFKKIKDLEIKDGFVEAKNKDGEKIAF